MSSLALAAAHCTSTVGTVAEPQPAENVETVSSAVSGGPATGLTNVWRTDFTYYNVAGTMPNSTSDWVYELFEPNGEVEQYTTNYCNGNTSPYGTSWNYCIQGGQATGSGQTTDGSVLQIRAQNDGGIIHSGRLNSKRMHEFTAVGPNQGIQYEASIKFDANSVNQGSWPAFWMLQRNLNEPPVMNDGDNISWPCLGAQETDIMEMGSLGSPWTDWYTQGTLHYDTGGCYPQNPNQNPAVSNGGSKQLDDGTYHKYTLEFECGSGGCGSSSTMRWFVDGVQENGDMNTTGTGFDQVASFFVLNYAVGGGLGGSVNYNAFNNPGRSMYVDYLSVNTYDVNNRTGSGGGNGADVLSAGHSLYANQAIVSPDGWHEAIMQSDGTFAVYHGVRNGMGMATKAWHTTGSGDHVSYQTDGNLVVYNGGSVVWAPNLLSPPQYIYGRGGEFLRMQNDGNLVAYTGNGGALWASNTSVSLGSQTGTGANFAPTLGKNGVMISPDWRFEAIMQPDGNFVVYEGESPLWSSNTVGSGDHVSFQGDGNLVVYTSGNQAVFSAATNGAGGTTLSMRSDGTLVILNSGGGVVWSSATCHWSGIVCH
jgi:hypothetical protein